MSSTCFETEGSSSGCVQYRSHTPTYKTAYTEACKTYNTVPVYIAVFLKMNLRVSKHVEDNKN